MKAQQWKRLVGPVLPGGEGWAHVGKLAYHRPTRWTVRGVLGESSGFSQATYVWRLVSPLFVPSDHLDLSYSERVGGPARSFEDADSDGLVAAVREAAGGVPSDERALHMLAAWSLDTQNVRVFETVGYAQLLLGEPASAARTLGRVSGLDRHGDEPAWIGEVMSRMSSVGALLSNGRTDEATALLDGWAEATGDALRVQRSRP